MIFLIECVIACLLFTAALEILAARRREVFVNDYPPVVTDRLRGLGLVAQTPPSQPPRSCCSEKTNCIPFLDNYGIILVQRTGVLFYGKWDTRSCHRQGTHDIMEKIKRNRGKQAYGSHPN